MTQHAKERRKAATFLLAPATLIKLKQLSELLTAHEKGAKVSKGCVIDEAVSRMTLDCEQ